MSIELSYQTERRRPFRVSRECSNTHASPPSWGSGACRGPAHPPAPGTPRLAVGTIGLTAAALGSLLLTCSALRAHHNRRIRSLNSEIARLSRAADRDPLTGLGNRRSFERCLAMEWRRALRHGSRFTLALVDADNFKAFNDTYGHLAGDVALMTVSQCIAGALGRAGDGAFRIGGEEFALILPDADEAGAARIGQRVCDAVVSAAIAHDGAAAGVLTVSFGSCSALVEGCATAIGLLAVADRALYDAKAQGRNRAVCTTPIAAAFNAV